MASSGGANKKSSVVGGTTSNYASVVVDVSQHNREEKMPYELLDCHFVEYRRRDRSIAPKLLCPNLSFATLLSIRTMNESMDLV